MPLPRDFPNRQDFRLPHCRDDEPPLLLPRNGFVTSQLRLRDQAAQTFAQNLHWADTELSRGGSALTSRYDDTPSPRSALYGVQPPWLFGTFDAATAFEKGHRRVFYDEHASPRVRSGSPRRSIGTRQATLPQQGRAVRSHRVYSASVGVQGVAKPRLIQQNGQFPASISFQYQTLTMHTTSTAWRGWIFRP